MRESGLGFSKSGLRFSESRVSEKESERFVFPFSQIPKDFGNWEIGNNFFHYIISRNALIISVYFLNKIIYIYILCIYI